MWIDLNHGSGFAYGGASGPSVSDRVNALIDDALVMRYRRQQPRDYLGGSRIGEPCARKLAYEVTHTAKDDGQDFDGAILRIFDAGHQFETLSVRWLRAAGFDLRTHRSDGEQFGFITANGRIRGHIDGVIVAGPDVGLPWPALWEHKAVNAKSWVDIAKRGVRLARPVYYAQLQIYMAYMDLGAALFTVLNKDNQALHHEIVAFEAAAAQALSDIVLDEVSMVGTEMAADLLAFGKPILVLGDPGQLPPIKGTGAFTDVAPDVMLTEIHRQAGESAIIRLATMARRGEPIPYGAHDDHVWKMRRTEVTPQQLLRGGQVICGRNATRLQLNSAMKHAAGFASVLPEGSGEKIICLKNRHDLGLVTGMFVSLAEIRDEGRGSFSAPVTTEDGVEINGRQHFYKGHYDDHVRPDPDRSRRDWKEMRGLIETVWGYAITGHKAQGSSYSSVIVYDDGFGRTAEERSRWLYTAITRAEWGLVILD